MRHIHWRIPTMRTRSLVLFHFAEYSIRSDRNHYFRFSFPPLAKLRSLVNLVVKTHLLVSTVANLPHPAHTFSLALTNSPEISSFNKGKLLIMSPHYVSFLTWEGRCKSHLVMSRALMNSFLGGVHVINMVTMTYAPTYSTSQSRNCWAWT